MSKVINFLIIDASFPADMSSLKQCVLVFELLRALERNIPLQAGAHVCGKCAHRRTIPTRSRSIRAVHFEGS